MSEDPVHGLFLFRESFIAVVVHRRDSILMIYLGQTLLLLRKMNDADSPDLR